MSNRIKNRPKDLVALKADLPSIAGRLRLWRTRKSFTQQKVCDDLGVPLSTWSNYEQGTRRIPLDTAIAMQLIYELPIEWVYLEKQHGLTNDDRKLLGDEYTPPKPVHALAPIPAARDFRNRRMRG